MRKEKDADPEDRDEYLAQNVFRVPKGARQPFLQGKANQVSKKNLFLILEKPS